MVEGNLTCKELVEVITSYLDDALSPEQREHFERHLALCPGCRVYLDQMRTTLRLLGTLSAENLPETMQRDLLAAFRNLCLRSGDS